MKILSQRSNMVQKMDNNMKNRIWILIPLIIFVLFYKLILLNEIPLAGDMVAHEPIKQWISEQDEMPHWFPNLFSGMPSYGGYIYTPGDPTKALLSKIFINQGLRFWFYFTLAGLGVFSFLRRKKINEWASTLGGLIFSLTPYSFGLINAGHNNKILAFAWLPWVFMASEKVIEKYSIKSILTLGLFTAFQMWSNHPQVVYYTWMLIGFRLVWLQGESIVDKSWNIISFSKSFGGLIASVILALTMVGDPYVSVFEFNKYSNRGSSSVLDQTNETKSGMKWEKATQWSFHPSETISFLYPYYYGLQNYPTRDIKSASYWGYMPFTQSTHYFGILVLLIALLGAYIKKPNRFEWSMWIVSLLAIIIGFGNHFPILFSPFFNWAPFFSKFRVPSMVYMTIPFMMSYLGAVGFNRIMNNINDNPSRVLNKAYYIFGTFIGLSLLLFMGGESLLSFFKEGEMGRYNAQIINSIRETRAALFQKGFMVALGISGASLAIIWAGCQKKITHTITGAALVGLVVLDLGLIDSEFLHLKPSIEMSKQFQTNQGIEFLKNEYKSEPFRIYPKDGFSSNRYGYYGLESVGGYRPLKLRHYQDLMDASTRDGKVEFSPAVQNMLNIRYVIDKGRLLPNPNYLHRAWMVNSIIPVEDQESSLMTVLQPTFSPENQAVILAYDGQLTFEEGMNEVLIEQIEENKIILNVNSEKGGLLVLSEIYYKPGWKAFVDDVETAIYQTNHVLRSLVISSGNHHVIMKYDDQKWKWIRLISRISFFGTLVGLLFLNRDSLLRIIKK